MANTSLTAKQIDELKQRLVSERQRILKRRETNFKSAVEQESRFADSMDEATRDEDAGLLLQLTDHDRDHLFEIDAALARMDDGSYGLSEDSGDPIDFGRLQARPWARYSAAEQEQLEQDESRTRNS